MSATMFLFLLYFIPFLIGIITAYCLKKFNRKIWPLVVIFTLLIALLFLCSENLPVVTKLYYRMSGHYNIEAVGFYLLFAMRSCSGFFTGTLTGYVLQRLK